MTKYAKTAGEDAQCAPNSLQRAAHGIKAYAAQTGSVMLLCMAGLLPGQAVAQTYPDRPVTIVVPFAPGAAVDLTARLVADELGKVFGQTFVVENRPGAAGTVGYASVIRGAQDGYTLLIGYSATTACSLALNPDLGWDPVKDLAAIGRVAGNALMLSVNVDLPVNTASELVDYLKAHPGDLAYGSSGIGSMAHLATEQFLKLTGTEMVHVPYKGAGEQMVDLLSGITQFGLLGAPAIKKHVEDGKIKALAVARATPDPTMPDVPTVDEAGLPGYYAEGWIGLFSPSGVDPEIIQTLSDGLKKVAAHEDLPGKFINIGQDLQYFDPSDTALQIEKDAAGCVETVRSIGINQP